MSLDSKFVIIPGAQKAGTTTLHQLITQHSKIAPLTRESGKPVKEPAFFAMETNHVEKNISWYKSLVKSNNHIYVDASVQYLMSPQAPNLIRKHLGHKRTKLIFVVRDPVSRTISGFLQQKSKTPPTDRRNIDNIIKRVYKHSSMGLVDSETYEVENAAENEWIDKWYLENIQKGNRPFDVRLQDKLITFKHIQYSLYSRHIASYDGFDKKIVCFENMVQNTQRVMNSIFNFLGVASEEVNMTHSNPTRVPTKKRRVYTYISKYLRQNKELSEFMDTSILNYIKSILRPDYMSSGEAKERISREAKEMLRELLNPEYRYWSERSENIVQYWDQ